MVYTRESQPRSPCADDDQLTILEEVLLFLIRADRRAHDRHIQLEERIATMADDLKTKFSALQADYATLHTDQVASNALIGTLVSQIADLKAAADAAETVDPDVLTAIDALDATVQSDDAAVKAANATGSGGSTATPTPTPTPAPTPTPTPTPAPTPTPTPTSGGSDGTGSPAPVGGTPTPTPAPTPTPTPTPTSIGGDTPTDGSVPVDAPTDGTTI